jgi:hypothetical protein
MGYTLLVRRKNRTLAVRIKYLFRQKIALRRTWATNLSKMKREVKRK